MKTMKARLFVLFLLMSSVAFAQTGYNDFDTNGDGGIDQNEFNETYQNNISNWDADGDSYVSDREFYDASFNRFDRDRDNNLSEDEWNEGFDTNYGAYLSTRDYNEFDTDQSQNISSDEFYNSMRSTDYYSTYDANRDNRIDNNELGEGIFNEVDANRDGKLDNNEYNNFNSNFNDNGIRR